MLDFEITPPNFTQNHLIFPKSAHNWHLKHREPTSQPRQCNRTTLECLSLVCTTKVATQPRVTLTLGRENMQNSVFYAISVVQKLPWEPGANALPWKSYIICETHFSDTHTRCQNACNKSALSLDFEISTRIRNHIFCLVASFDACDAHKKIVEIQHFMENILEGGSNPAKKVPIKNHS